jgi:hypothetical protein
LTHSFRGFSPYCGPGEAQHHDTEDIVEQRDGVGGGQRERDREGQDIPFKDLSN